MFSALLLAGFLAGCEDPAPIPDAGGSDAGVSEDGGKGPEDVGTRGPLRLPSGQLYPSAEEAAGEGHVLRGRLGAHGVHTATSPRHRLRGGFRPLAR